MAFGSSSIIALQEAVGDQRIDGILSGIKWSGPKISYSMPDSMSDYPVEYFIGVDTSGFSKFTSLQAIAFHTAINSVEGLTNLDGVFADGGSGQGTIRAANINAANPSAYAYYPDDHMWGGDLFEGGSYDGTAYSLKAPVAGNYAWSTMLHEIGHTLGLKHGHESGGPADVALPGNVDSIEFSVMTYRTYVDGPPGYSTQDFPQTFMMLDVAALQEMYGANFTANSGNTTYTWDPNLGTTFVNGVRTVDAASEVIFATIWDGGGIDTYDLSSYETDLFLDLEPGGSCSFGGQLSHLGGGQNDGFARGNIFNALQFHGDPRSLIENAIGGTGDDVIIGNDATNVLIGGAGNDVMTGGVGPDTFVFDTKNRKISADYITDFLPGTDTITLDSSVFKKLNAGGLKEKAFFSDDDVRAHDKNDRILYDTESGDCYYDKDGNGANKAKRFATLDSHPDDFGSIDFLIVV